MAIACTIAVTGFENHCFTKHFTTESVEGESHGFHKPQSGPLQCDFEADSTADCTPDHSGAHVCLDSTVVFRFFDNGHGSAIDIFSSIFSLNPASATVLLFASNFFFLYQTFPKTSYKQSGV